jgi:hypothetical protein
MNAGEMAPEFHWFAFAFRRETEDEVQHAQCYRKFLTRAVTRIDIEKARDAAGIGVGAVMLSCSYLGQMTISAFDSGVEDNDL